jgi:hypothetical protein
MELYLKQRGGNISILKIVWLFWEDVHGDGVIQDRSNFDAGGGNGRMG